MRFRTNRFADYRFLLVYMLLRYSPTVDFMTVFTIIASGVIVFVPLYKNRRHKDR